MGNDELSRGDFRSEGEERLFIFSCSSRRTVVDGERVFSLFLPLTSPPSDLRSLPRTGPRSWTKDGSSASNALGGGSYRQPTTHNLPRFLPPAERNWRREAILACVSRLAKAKPLLAAGSTSRQKWSPIFVQITSSLLTRSSCHG